MKEAAALCEQASFDYEAQSGQLLFRRGVDSQDIKIMIKDDEEIGRNKYFSVKLDAVEGGTLDAWWCRARVVVVDDGLRVVEHIMHSSSYSAVSACCTIFALVGDDLLQPHVTEAATPCDGGCNPT